MRKLTEEELTLIQKSIIRKEISATELLGEIHDHYVTHLETLPVSDFHAELSLLDQKWTQDYCKQLQRDLQNSINKSIRSLQWQLAKSYFSWPRMIFTSILVVLIATLINLLAWDFQLIVLLIPLVFLIALGIIISVRTHRKNKAIKKLFNFKNSGIFILSFQSSNFISHVIWPVHSLNLFILAPRIWGMHDVVAVYIINMICILFGAYLILHSLTIFEAWKIKSKTSLI
ncbi:hypothetical protein [Algoriphagus chordae]|uniref:Uncharacterized protein n=1 Tax=Algoriphagus chordae TaxID=237019 RepID=A0A2W7QN04_9BACT|nr:hypothetical protein [Algoriphagus chordae]PZX48656.1 hypothetical protein LV85_03470 [Algoriphagus chordae]